ncbi:hypothetical protein ACEPPN_017812 [Leptodophora sp. 'Broadleaf-Isolate-01']
MSDAVQMTDIQMSDAVRMTEATMPDASAADAPMYDAPIFATPAPDPIFQLVESNCGDKRGLDEFLIGQKDFFNDFLRSSKHVRTTKMTCGLIPSDAIKMLGDISTREYLHTSHNFTSVPRGWISCRLNYRLMIFESTTNMPHETREDALRDACEHVLLWIYCHRPRGEYLAQFDPKNPEKAIPIQPMATYAPERNHAVVVHQEGFRREILYGRCEYALILTSHVGQKLLQKWQSNSAIQSLNSAARLHNSTPIYHCTVSKEFRNKWYGQVTFRDRDFMCEELLDSKHEAIVEVARLAHAWSRNEDEMAEEQAKALKAIKAKTAPPPPPAPRGPRGKRSRTKKSVVKPTAPVKQLAAPIETQPFTFRPSASAAPITKKTVAPTSAPLPLAPPPPPSTLRTVEDMIICVLPSRKIAVPKSRKK